MPPRAREGRRRGRASWSRARARPGHFHDLVAASGADVDAAPLGDHPLVAEIALERYEAALGA